MAETVAEAVDRPALQTTDLSAAGPQHRDRRWPRVSISPGRRVQLIIFAVLLGGMVSTGWWLGRKIEERVVSNTVHVNQLYVDSLITPAIQDLRSSPVLAPADIAALDEILHKTPLGAQVAALILWGEGGRVLYSSSHLEIGAYYPPTAELERALAGQLTWGIGSADEVEPLVDRRKSRQLLELYSPVRDVTSGRTLAVVEFYQPFDPLARDIAAARREMWLVVGIVTGVVYLVLAGFVEWASATIAGQQRDLHDQVEQLTELLRQNDQLYERIQRATRSAATMHERLLRRISADLHDGPAQYLGAMALHMDRITRYHAQRPDPAIEPHVTRAERAMHRALEELRVVATGLGLPQLEAMSLDAVIAQVVDRHEELTNTTVAVSATELPEQISTAIKVTVYRVLQEALSNAYRHGRGANQKVEAIVEGGVLGLLVCDHGPGFDVERALDSAEHLGLAGMRDRVESLGGHFTITSRANHGTWVRVLLPLEEESADGRA